MPINNQWHSLRNEDAPEAAGVYELGNSNGAVVYIGRSGNLRQRLNQHANADGRSCLGKNASRFRYDSTSSYISRERELFTEYKDSHGGDIPPCNENDPSA